MPLNIWSVSSAIYCWVSSGICVTVSTIKSNVAVNTKLLSEQLQLNRKTIQRDLLVLRNKNLIQWIGSAKTGHWEVTK